jgi:hypothetical protein
VRAFKGQVSRRARVRGSVTAIGFAASASAARRRTARYFFTSGALRYPAYARRASNQNAVLSTLFRSETHATV